MGFTSVVFLFVFFPAAILGYYLFWYLERKVVHFKGRRLSDGLLVLESLAFYACSGVSGLIGLCLYVIGLWVLGKNIQHCRERKKSAKGLLFTGILLLTAVLYYFKYYNFTLEILRRFYGENANLLPVTWSMLGISFITFSAISYLVDIYRGDVQAGTFLDMALYVTFFPKVASGPLILWKDFKKNLPVRIFNESRFLYGINRFILGFFKKVVLADALGMVVADIQSQTASGIDMPTAWGCTFLYFLQIYYDFSGYSDTAIGLAAMYGFDVKENFHFPYISQSVSEFWRRWHISLGTWFREYVYIPLGGNRKGFTKTLRNLFLVFLLTGIWHGAGIGYLLWGVIHGICTVAERCIREKKFYTRVPGIVKWACTMFIVMMGWQFFRISSMTENLEFWRILFGAVKFETVNFTWEYYFTAKTLFLAGIGAIGAVLPALPGLRIYQQKMAESRIGNVVQEIALFALFAVTIMCMVNSTYSPFIYFQY